jgi:hypothetical protein
MHKVPAKEFFHQSGKIFSKKNVHQGTRKKIRPLMCSECLRVKLLSLFGPILRLLICCVCVETGIRSMLR